MHNFLLKKCVYLNLCFCFQCVFYFLISISVPTTFSFGAKSAPDKANTDTTKKEVAPSKPFVFASSSTSSSSGFNFSMSSNLKPELDQKLKLVSAGADSVNVAKKEEG